MKRSRIRFTFGACVAVLGCFCGVASALAAGIPKKDIWYTQHYMIMQGFERKAYKDLSETGRKEFQTLFWAARPAETQAKFQSRLDYVNLNFKTENRNQPWNTDRGRVYLLNGSPASVDFDQNNSWAMMPTPGSMSTPSDRTNEDVAANRAEIWVYPYDKYFIKYTFAFAQPNQWRITQTTGSRYLGELETYNRTVTFGVKDEAAYKQALDALLKKK